MGIFGIIAVIIVVSIAIDRAVNGDKAVAIRERKDAQQLGGMMEGIGEALPFLGTQNYQMPAPPPAVELEPDYGHNQIHLDDQGFELAAGDDEAAQQAPLAVEPPAED